MKIVSRTKAFLYFTLILLVQNLSATDLDIEKFDKGYQVKITKQDQVLLHSPEQGLWRIATGWKDRWPADWKNFHPQTKSIEGDWTILEGEFKIKKGILKIKDSYKKSGDRIKCIRRYEWSGDRALEKVTLSIDWQSRAHNNDVMLPGILYYGNPSGAKNGKNRVPVFTGQAGEQALFEEHRFSMPFASVEWHDNEKNYGAALHSTPSPVPFANKNDQWWSLGVKSNAQGNTLQILSGPCTYNGKKSVVKAQQTNYLNYNKAYLDLPDGGIIEKTFYIEGFEVEQKGSGFIQPIKTALELHQPYFDDAFPDFETIINSKLKFADTRWISGHDYSGYCMYPVEARREIVMGWCGQAASPGYALQLLNQNYNDRVSIEKIQSSLDFLTNSPINEQGYHVRFYPVDEEWSGQDFVSQGQGMYNFAKAIQAGRKNNQVNTEKWEKFLKEVSQVHSKRILQEDWKPVSTNQGFVAAPLFIASNLFDNPTFQKAALKIVEHYGDRHLNMDEPYWGGTLDATCEDKEGAWAGFQAFLYAYKYSGQEKYLKWAEHAAYAALSYTVIWNIPLPPGRLANHNFKTRGWTVVSPQNQHVDVYGVLIAPSVYQLGIYKNDANLKQLAKVMFRSCGQIIDPKGSQGEQIQHTNFAQRGEMSDINKLRGGYSEDWTVFWITAHFLNAAAQFQELGVIK